MTHDPVGRCIYCDSTDNLSDEHITAYGLGGSDILPKSSCRKCAQITGKMEQEVLRGLWWLTRAVLNFPTRRPEDMPKSFVIHGETKDGEKKDITLQDDDKIAMAGFPEYASPAFLAKREPISGILMTGHRMVGFGSSIEDLAKKNNLRTIEGEISYKGTSFARMLAKIALGTAVVRFGLESFAEIYVRDSILNNKDDVGTWVGGDYWEISQEHLDAERKTRHSIAVSSDPSGNVLVRIRLFSFTPYSPAYIVVVGKLKQGKFAKTDQKGQVFGRTLVLPKAVQSKEGIVTRTVDKLRAGLNFLKNYKIFSGWR